MLIDMHSHSDGDVTFIEEQQRAYIATILNATTRAEFHFNEQYAGSQQVLSYGVHPWETQRQPMDEQLLSQVAIIGEIGLDTVWTDVPLSVQRPVFLQQLHLAYDLHRPVILHTKGCESEILNDINELPDLTVLVHWYSSAKLQAAYIARPNSYFSIGPDVLTDEVVQTFAQKVPLSQLFIESDGLESFQWVLKRDVHINEYAGLLKQVYQKVADLRTMSVTQLEAQIEKNWQHLFS
ncbi:TatD family hydrolase [Weissella paramesenteroides]|uniref:TatD family hydrolase n=1 Tax=Weissella paramesenteroides TaxID=1249 RepID=UPI001C1F2CE0|nr:TatD family hydrolase [Weissella paramesenteroides]MBU7557439.1 TatD family hydrolase [Weissella paramesenteroides]